MTAEPPGEPVLGFVLQWVALVFVYLVAWFSTLIAMLAVADSVTWDPGGAALVVFLSACLLPFFTAAGLTWLLSSRINKKPTGILAITVATFLCLVGALYVLANADI